MLKIKNLENGAVENMVRDVCHSHSEWVHEQCGTESESELQRMMDQMYYEDYAAVPDKLDEFGIFMDSETAREWLEENA